MPRITSSVQACIKYIFLKQTNIILIVVMFAVQPTMDETIMQAYKLVAAVKFG